MKKILVLIICVVIGAAVFCSCSTNEQVRQQTGKLTYSVDAGWSAKVVSPAPATFKQYKYNDYTVSVESVSYNYYEEPLQEALDYAIGQTHINISGSQGTNDNYLDSEGEVNNMPAKEISLTSNYDDGSLCFYGVFTAVETDTGYYVFSTVTTDPEQKKLTDRKHSDLKDTIEYVETGDPEVYSKEILQFSDYISAVPGWDTYVVDVPWWTERIEYADGAVNYVFGEDISSVKGIPMENVQLTDAVIVESLEKIYNGKLGPDAECSIAGRELMEAAIGSAVYVETDLKFGEGTVVKSSAVFILNQKGDAVCCISNTSDSDLGYDYSGITQTIQEAEPVYSQIDHIYELATEYLGDNSSVINMMNALGFSKYGDYTIELHTEKEPYGLTINYKNDIKDYDFKREAIMMIGLIGNLDYIDINDSNSDIVHYDYDLAKSLMKYDVKKMSSEKSRLEVYYLDTMF